MDKVSDAPTVCEAAKELVESRMLEIERELQGKVFKGYEFIGVADNSGTWYWTNVGEEMVLAATPFWMNRLALPIDKVGIEGEIHRQEVVEIPLDLDADTYLEEVKRFIEEELAH